MTDPHERLNKLIPELADGLPVREALSLIADKIEKQQKALHLIAIAQASVGDGAKKLEAAEMQQIAKEALL